MKYGVGESRFADVDEFESGRGGKNTENNKKELNYEGT